MTSTERKVDAILAQMAQWEQSLNEFSSAISKLNKQNQLLNSRMQQLQSEVQQLKTSHISIPSPPRSPVVDPIPARTLSQLLMQPASPCSSVDRSLHAFKSEAKAAALKPSAKSPSICSLAARSGECSDMQRIDKIKCNVDCSGAMPGRKEANYKHARELAIRCGYDQNDIPSRFKE